MYTLSAGLLAKDRRGLFVCKLSFLSLAKLAANVQVGALAVGVTCVGDGVGIGVEGGCVYTL